MLNHLKSCHLSFGPPCLFSCKTYTGKRCINWWCYQSKVQTLKSVCLPTPCVPRSCAWIGSFAMELWVCRAHRSGFLLTMEVHKFDHQYGTPSAYGFTWIYWSHVKFPQEIASVKEFGKPGAKLGIRTGWNLLIKFGECLVTLWGVSMRQFNHWFENQLCLKEKGWHKNCRKTVLPASKHHRLFWFKLILDCSESTDVPQNSWNDNAFRKKDPAAHTLSAQQNQPRTCYQWMLSMLARSKVRRAVVQQLGLKTTALSSTPSCSSRYPRVILMLVVDVAQSCLTNWLWMTYIVYSIHLHTVYWNIGFILGCTICSMMFLIEMHVAAWLKSRPVRLSNET